MFTGLVEETGRIIGLKRKGGSVVFSIRGRKTMRGMKIDHSIAVEGVCLTAIRVTRTAFDVQAVEETLRKTTLGALTTGSTVNLERPLRPTDRLGGHFVLGHVDGVGAVDDVQVRKSSWIYWIRVPERFRHHLIPMGSIAVNGVSLTIAAVKGARIAISIIPHTMAVTTFRQLKPGDRVNLEFDVLGKMVDNLLQARRRKRRTR